MVPAYVPWHLFWAYFVGVALIAASLSIATKVEVRWSGLLFGIMMFLFEAMLHVPRAVANPHDRIAWTIVFREMSFGGGGWILAGSAMATKSEPGSKLITFGRIVIGIAASILWSRALSLSSQCPGRSSRKNDSRMDSRAHAHQLSDRRDSSGCRGGHSGRARRRGMAGVQLILVPGLCCSWCSSMVRS